MPRTPRRRPTPVDYAKLLDFRTTLRRFLQWSEQEALAAGLTTAQHQLLLVIKGAGAPEGVTVGDVAEHLLIRHNSAGELVHRAEEGGLVSCATDKLDHRTVRVSLTRRGERALEQLAVRHLEEISRLAGALGFLGN